MDKQIIDVVECEILPAMDTFCELLQTGDITAGATYNLADILRRGMWARVREVTAGEVASQ